MRAFVTGKSCHTEKKIEGRILFLREFGFGCLDCLFVLFSFFLFVFTFTCTDSDNNWYQKHISQKMFIVASNFCKWSYFEKYNVKSYPAQDKTILYLSHMAGTFSLLQLQRVNIN